MLVVAAARRHGLDGLQFQRFVGLQPLFVATAWRLFCILAGVHGLASAPAADSRLAASAAQVAAVRFAANN